MNKKLIDMAMNMAKLLEGTPLGEEILLEEHVTGCIDPCDLQLVGLRYNQKENK